MLIKRGDGQIISVFDADEFLKKDSKKQTKKHGKKVTKDIDFNNDVFDELLISEEDDQGKDK